MEGNVLGVSVRDLVETAIIAAEGHGSAVADAVGLKWKEWMSLAIYALGIATAFLMSPYVAIALYVAVALIWLIPDRRFERRLQQ